MINIENVRVNVGGLGHFTNTYIVYEDVEKEGIIVDPGYEANKIISKIVELGISIKYIVLTNAHGDHTGALKEVYEYTKSKVLIHENDYDMLIGNVEDYSIAQGIKRKDLSSCDIEKVKDNFCFRVGILNFEIIHTPGHTAGGICLFEKTSNCLFTGDTIFYDCYGRCDLATANFEEMVNSIQKIFDSFDDIIIYPGHGRAINLSKAKKYIRMLLKMKGIELN